MLRPGIRGEPGSEARKIGQKEVGEVLKAEIIELTQSELAAPVLLFLKPDGILRFCFDLRRLKAVKLKDTYLLSRMDDSLRNTEVFSALNAIRCY